MLGISIRQQYSQSKTMMYQYFCCNFKAAVWQFTDDVFLLLTKEMKVLLLIR